MKIAVIDNYDSFVHNLIRYLKEESQAEIQVYRNTAIDLNELEQADGILLSPGPGLPQDAGQMMEVIERFHERKSILGVCLGHQALAHHFGIPLYRQAAPLHGKSSRVEHYHNGKLFQDLPDELEVGRYHSWLVSDEVDAQFTISCRTSTGEIMAMEHKQLNLHGVQFHPESLLTPTGRQMVRNWIHTLHKNT